MCMYTYNWIKTNSNFRWKLINPLHLTAQFLRKRNKITPKKHIFLLSHSYSTPRTCNGAHKSHRILKRVNRKELKLTPVSEDKRVVRNGKLEKKYGKSSTKCESREGVFQGGTARLEEHVDLSLPNLLADLDEAGFSGVIHNKMQVKRVYASIGGNCEIISHRC